MTSVTEGEATLQSISYCPDGKRPGLTDSAGTRKFFYDGDNVIQEYDSDWSSVNKEYTHGPWVDEPLSMTEHGQQNEQSEQNEANSTYYLMKDRLGSIINILDENEAMKTTYSYDAFGEPTATYHSGQVDCAYRFTGREYDAGMGNYSKVILAEAQPRPRVRERRLSARFFSRDPIMPLSSLYAYCGNSPANFTDPSGLEWEAQYSSDECGQTTQGENKGTDEDEEDGESWTSALPPDPLGPNPCPLEADTNGDGVVSSAEWERWEENQRMMIDLATAAADPTRSPEEQDLFMLTLALIAAYAAYGRHSQQSSGSQDSESSASSGSSSFSGWLHGYGVYVDPWSNPWWP